MIILIIIIIIQHYYNYIIIIILYNIIKVKQLEELIQRVDKELHDHLVKQEVLYLQFAFRWMNNLVSSPFIFLVV